MAPTLSARAEESNEQSSSASLHPKSTNSSLLTGTIPTTTAPLTNRVLQTDQMRPGRRSNLSFSKSAQEEEEEQDSDTSLPLHPPKNKIPIREEDVEESEWISPKMVFRYTREFVSKHPIAFLVFLVVVIGLLGVIYVQHDKQLLKGLLKKYGLMQDDDEEENGEADEEEDASPATASGVAAVEEDDEDDDDEDDEELPEWLANVVNTNNSYTMPSFVPSMPPQ